MVKEISIVDDDGKKIDNKGDLVVCKIGDKIFYIEVEEAKEIIKSLEGQILMIEMGENEQPASNS